MASVVKKGVSKVVAKTTSTDDDGQAREEVKLDPAEAAKYLLQVTAGPSYDSSTHGIVQVNGQSYSVDHPDMTAKVRVRIKDYNGLPKSSPSTHAYFDHPSHLKDLYSISFSFIPKTSIPSEEVIMGFDFDRPIRDRLPPGFRMALKFVTTIIDPGIYTEPYVDKPFLYGTGLGSFYSFRIGEKANGSLAEPEDVIEEGADGSGIQIREELGMPSDPSKRRKFFLKKENLDAFQFEAGREYSADFFNPYLDFANFAVRLPIFSISVARYIDEKTHTLRYVLKNRRTGEVYFAIVFTLLFGQQLADALTLEEKPVVNGNSADQDVD